MNKKYCFLPSFSYVCLIIIFSTIFVGCKKTLSIEECDELSMKSYKGIPRAAHIFKKKCQNVPIKFTHSTCQKALEKLIKMGSLKQVQAAFGERVRHCFTANDLKKFNNQ